MRGYHYDARAVSLNNLTLEYAMHPKYKPATHLNRSQLALQRRATVAKKRATAASADNSRESSPRKKAKPKNSPAQKGAIAQDGLEPEIMHTEVDDPTHLPSTASAGAPLTAAPPPAPAPSVPGPYLPQAAPSNSNPPAHSLQPPTFVVPPGYSIAWVFFMVPIPAVPYPPLASQQPGTENIE
ncbi:hypothetical protein FRC01_002444 [Tulasnella sp. 417]|nr:hypothetical protein FRC01_002444 [Tulasnella sp. 417]